MPSRPAISPGPESRVVELEAPLELQHELRAELAEFARFRTRKQLERSAVWQRHETRVQDLSFGLEYGRFATPGQPPQILRVVSWNIQRGTRLEAIGDALGSHPELKRADVVLLLESDLGMARSGNKNVALELARRLGYDYVYGNSYICLTAGNSREAHHTEPNRLALSGNAILSRLPIRRAENFSVFITKDKFESGEKRLGHKKALWVELEVGERHLTVAAVHLDSGASSAQRAAQLSDVVGRLEARGVAACSLIGGDFNTTTYDAQSVPAILANLCAKLCRGGFAHAIHHYLHPQLLYERRVFEVLRASGYEYETYNELGTGTLRYRVGDAGSEGRVRDFLPAPFVEILRRKLQPWGGAVGLKLDWFAGKGLTPFQVGTVPSLTHEGVGVSDHDPIWVDVGFSQR